MSNGAARGGVTLTLSGGQSGTATSDENGNYTFGNLGAGGNYTVTATGANLTFEPASRSINELSSNQSGADFVSTRVETAATPAGANVSLEFVDEDLTVNFANVTVAGTTTVREIDAATAASS